MFHIFLLSVYFAIQIYSLKTVIVSFCLQVAIFLYYISDEGRLRKTANAFGTAKSTVSAVIKEVASAVSENLIHLIKFPTTEDTVGEKVQGFFEAHGFPQCIGAIDGTHIPIAKPKNNPTDYINKSFTYSLNVQAVCDFKYQFLNVDISWPGSVHDARVFSNSTVNRFFKDSIVPPCPRVIVQNEPPVPVCLLGDPAYPLTCYLMKEFPGGGKDMQEQFFGFRLSSSRMVIENAFGRLKGRFRCLQRKMDLSLDSLPSVILSCFILHNYCEQENQVVSETFVRGAVEYAERFQPRLVRTVEASAEAKRIRNTYVRYFEHLGH
jgi:hypothetical protein